MNRKIEIYFNFRKKKSDQTKNSFANIKMFSAIVKALAIFSVVSQLVAMQGM